MSVLFTSHQSYRVMVNIRRICGAAPAPAEIISAEIGLTLNMTRKYLRHMLAEGYVRVVGYGGDTGVKKFFGETTTRIPEPPRKIPDPTPQPPQIPAPHPLTVAFFGLDQLTRQAISA